VGPAKALHCDGSVNVGAVAMKNMTVTAMPRIMNTKLYVVRNSIADWERMGSQHAIMLVKSFYPYPTNSIVASGQLMLERTQVYLRPVKALGQHFLINRAIAEVEAEHARGKQVLELGPGYGVLTKELCKRAKRVVAVELDRNLFTVLKHEMGEKNLKLINKDFFEASGEELELENADIMIANVPYKLSSKVIDFLLEHNMQAVLCLQREFVQHMVAKPGTRNYSRLSVMFQLGFSHTKLVEVSRGSFRPIPKVDSVVIYIKPKGNRLSENERKVISAMMQHKKKSVKNALVDSSDYLGKTNAEMRAVASRIAERESKVFKLSPEEILKVADKVSLD
jgi:16S rRNA (adenine1518-N6/adenine1519-N6)-dimethyltransferase